jgi:superfamily II DNA or RNA helicase
MPISWRGTLAQYAGRLHRLHAAKREVVIYDYVDADEPMLAKMAARREAGYRALGYEIVPAGDLFSQAREPADAPCARGDLRPAHE